MRKLLLVLFLGVVYSGVQAQSNVIDYLAKENDLGCTVIVKTTAEIKFAKPVYKSNVRGYRVRIFSDNQQNSREQAQLMSKKFKSFYPTLNSYQEYASPYFRVTVGDFLTRAEAVSLWGKIKNNFPTAFVVSQNIPYSLVLNSPDVVLQVVDSLAMDSLAFDLPVITDIAVD